MLNCQFVVFYKPYGMKHMILYTISETTKILRAKDLSKLASQTLRVSEYIHFM